VENGGGEVMTKREKLVKVLNDTYKVWRNADKVRDDADKAWVEADKVWDDTYDTWVDAVKALVTYDLEHPEEVKK
jgi:hypothetical protein